MATYSAGTTKSILSGVTRTTAPLLPRQSNTASRPASGQLWPRGDGTVRTG